MEDKTPSKGAWPGSCDPIKFLGPNDISGMDEARIIEFCIQIDNIKFYLSHDKPPLIGA